MGVIVRQYSLHHMAMLKHISHGKYLQDVLVMQMCCHITLLLNGGCPQISSAEVVLSFINSEIEERGTIV